MTRLKRIGLPLLATSLVLVRIIIQVGTQWFNLPPSNGRLVGTQDPDPWLRLTLVREWLQGGGWYNHLVTHGNAPFGDIASPWTRPLDLVIAFFTSIQPDSVPLDIQLIRAALLIPLFWMALLLLGIQRNVRLFSPLAAAPFVVAVLASSAMMLWNYFSPANADHHSMLAVVFVFALYAVLHPSPTPRMVVLSGLLFALQLWVSPEAILLIAAIYGWYGLQWLRNDARAAVWPLLATSIAAGSAVALMIERPPSEWATPLYDSISIVYVAMLMLAASVVWALRFFTPQTLVKRGALAAALAALAGAVLLYAFPLLPQGPLAGADPFILSNFMPRIVEAQTLLTTPPLYMFAMLVQPLIALVVLCLALYYRPTIFTRAQVEVLAYLLVATGGLYITQQRFCYYFYPVVLLVLAPFFAALLQPESPLVRSIWPASALAGRSELRQLLIRLPLIMAVVGLPVVLLSINPSSRSTEQSRAIDACITSARRLIYNGQLNTLGGGKSLTLFASTDLGGELLFFTPHRIIASNYHREGAGIRYIWEADAITDTAELRRYLAQRKVDALILCPVVKSPENSALQLLREGRIHVPWLRLVNYTLTLPPSAKAEEKNNKPAIFLLR